MDIEAQKQDYRAAFKKVTEWSPEKAAIASKKRRYQAFIKLATNDVLPKMDSDLAFKAEMLKDFGFLSDMMDRFEDGKRYLEEARSLYERLDDKAGLVEVHFLLGDHYMSAGQGRKAISHYSQAVKLAGRSTSLSELKANAYWGISDIYRLTGSYQKALKELTKAEKIYRRNGSDKGTSNILWTRGYANIYLGNLEIAERCFAEIIDICRAGKLDDSEKAPALGAYGDVHRLTGRFNESLLIYDEAENLMELMEDQTQCAWIGAVRGLSLLHLGREKDAHRTIHVAVTLARRTGDSSSTIWALQAKGELRRLRNELDDAEKCYLESQSIARAEEFKVETAHSYLGLSEVSRQMGGNAKPQLKKALKSYRQLGVKWGIAECEKRLELAGKKSREHGGVLNWP